jgi:hypothetical protein
VPRLNLGHASTIEIRYRSSIIDHWLGGPIWDTIFERPSSRNISKEVSPME